MNINLEGLSDVKLNLKLSTIYLRNAKNTISWIGIPKDFSGSGGLKNTPNKISNIEKDLNDIQGWIEDVINKFNNAEINNKKLMQSMNVLSRISSLESKLNGIDEDDLIRETLNRNTIIAYRKAKIESILNECVVVMNDLLENNVKYSTTSGLTRGDIAEASDFSKHRCCCATYVSVVLYKSGVLSEEFINQYNYNYTGEGGVGQMLHDAGWEEITEEDVEPGDVCIYPPMNGNPGHVFFYAGGNEIWDQKSGCISSKGADPLKGTSSEWDKFSNSHDLSIWRVPIKVEETKDVNDVNEQDK